MVNIENEWLNVEISNNGAEIRGVYHKKNELDYMWSGDPTYWGRVSPVLFPIVGRLKGDQYQLNGKTYNMSQHGFLRDVEFEVDKQTSTSVTFGFNSAGRFTQVYPYEFKAYIHYVLKENSLIVQWEIINENEEEMYFSIGGHPAFKVPLLENESIEDYRVQLTPMSNKQVVAYELKDFLIHEKGPVDDVQIIQLSHPLFKNDVLAHSNIKSAKLFSAKSNHSVELIIEGFPFVGVWSAYMDDIGEMAPFVCIEPWYGIADTYDTSGNLKEKLGINKLGIGERFRAEYKVKFE